MINRQYKIGRYVAWLTLLPLIVMSVLLEAVFLHDRTANMEQNLKARGELLARQLAASSEYGVFSYNREFLRTLSLQVLHEPDVMAVRITDHDGHELAAVGEVDVPLMSSGKLRGSGAGNILLFRQPITSTQLALDDLEDKPAVQQIGTVAVALSWQKTRQEQFRIMTVVIVATLCFLFLVLYGVFRASRKLIDPVYRLSGAIRAIGRGELHTRIRQHADIDELGQLSAGINVMAEQLQQERAHLQLRIDEATEQLRQLAFFDTLTGLPNRRLLSDRLNQVLAASGRSERYAAVMFMDLDKFKPLNDKYGHSVGDLLLIEAARRIESCLRAVDTVARFGGDEFVVLLNELDEDRDRSVKQAQIVAEKIRTTLSQPYNLLYQPQDQPPLAVSHECTVSIGMVLFHGQHANHEQVLARADAAMYQAKESGNAIQFMDELTG
ncbi:MAG: diguanylate cyclase [Pseudomonadota bacterium]